MKRVPELWFIAAILVALFAVLATAQPVVGAPDEFETTAAVAWRGVQSGGGWAIAAALLSLGVFVVRKLAVRLPHGRVRAALLSDVGGVLLTLASSFLAGALHAELAGLPLGWEYLRTAVNVALVAMGGFVGLKRAGRTLVAALERRLSQGAPS